VAQDKKGILEQSPFSKNCRRHKTESSFYKMNKTLYRLNESSKLIRKAIKMEKIKRFNSSLLKKKRNILW